MAAITDLAATAQVGGTILLTWTNKGVYNWYNIWRSVNADLSGCISLAAPDYPLTEYSDDTADNNIRYYYMVQAHATPPETGGVSNTASSAMWTVAGADTVTVSDGHATSQTLKTQYAYYLSGINGMVYHYGPSYTADGASTILSYWRSKTFDFSELYPQFADYFYTVSSATLTYVDKGSHGVSIFISTDGGQNWSWKSKTLGNGDGSTKRSVFYFWKTGKYFDFKIEHSSTTATFQWIELEITFEPTATYREVS